MSITGAILGIVLSVAMIAGGIALLVPLGGLHDEPHHGEALDGLDGIGNFIALLSGGAGLVLLVVGGLSLRATIKGLRALPPAPPPAPELPVARVRDEVRAAEIRRRE